MENEWTSVLTAVGTWGHLLGPTLPAQHSMSDSYSQTSKLAMQLAAQPPTPPLLYVAGLQASICQHISD